MIFCKYVVLKMSRFRLDFLLKVSVSERQCLGLEDFDRDSSSGLHKITKIDRKMSALAQPPSPLVRADTP